jgi:hypothetical protein
VPAKIRKALILHVGDNGALSLDEDGALRTDVRPILQVADMTFGSLRPRSQPTEGKDLRQHFMEAAEDRDERSKHLA